MKKIVIITSYLSGNGGIEQVLKRMHKIISEDEFEFHILSLTGGNNVSKVSHNLITKTGCEDWLKDIPSKRFPYGSKLRILNYISHAFVSAFYLTKIKPDYVICTGPSHPLFLVWIRRLINLKFKILMWPHFSLDSGFGDFSGIVKADCLLAISRGIIEQSKLLGMPEDKIEYFPNPFEDHAKDIGIFESNKQELVRFVYIGRLLFLGQKRIKDIIDAAELLSGEFEIIFIGDGSDYSIINDYILEKKLSDKISIIKGWFENPWGVVSDIDALILSSEFEGLPTVLGEAMSRGISCISSDCKTGPTDFIENNVNGYIYPVGDVVTLAKLMQRYINHEAQFEPRFINESVDFFYDQNYKKRFYSLFNDKFSRGIQ